MKIGILTLRLFKNYGGILQNYALSRFLQKNGYDVETINIVWSYQLNGVKKYFVWLKRLVRNMLIGKWYSLDEEKILRNNELVAAQRVNAFKEKNIPLSQKVYSLPGADFSDISNKYDTIIVGSDQVWRPKYTGGIEKYFLSFADNRIKKIAYSASFGTDKNEYSFYEKWVCGKLIKRFDAISVREESAISLIREQLHWDVDVIQTLDPTMLLDITDYKSLVGQVVNNNKIFVYILDSSVQKTSRHIIGNILYTERREQCPIFATGQSITGHEKQVVYEKFHCIMLIGMSGIMYRQKRIPDNKRTNRFIRKLEQFIRELHIARYDG